MDNFAPNVRRDHIISAWSLEDHRLAPTHCFVAVRAHCDAWEVTARARRDLNSVSTHHTQHSKRYYHLSLFACPLYAYAHCDYDDYFYHYYRHYYRHYFYWRALTFHASKGCGAGKSSGNGNLWRW